MRFLLLGGEFGMTGAGLILQRYAGHLISRGHDVAMVPRPNDAGPLEDGYRASGVRILPASGDVVIERGTIALCNTLMAGADLLRFAPHAPAAWWIHEGEIGLNILLRSPGLSNAFAQARLIVLPTPVLRDRIYPSFLLGVPADRIAIIPYGIDPPAPAPAAEVTRPPGPVRVVVIGSIYPRKRPLDLLHALSLLPDLPIELHYVGRDHGLEPEFAVRAEAAGPRVRLHGELPHAAAMAVLAQADIFALPSASECLPISPLEAGIRGIPSVLSDLAGHEGVWRHGQNCLIHPVADTALLAHMLRVLAIDPALRQRLGAAAQQTARRFRTDLMLARLDLAIAGIS